MKVALITTAILLLASGASAQSGGHIGLYSDNPGFSDCFLVETLYATNSIYAVHWYIGNMPDASTAQFRVAHNWHGAVIEQVGFASNFQIGDIFTGVIITYVGCKPLPHLLAQMDFVPLTPTPECTVFFFVVPDPATASGQIEVVDCSSNLRFATGGYLVVNGSDLCLCWGLDPPPWVATEETTWGAIKVLYR